MENRQKPAVGETLHLFIPVNLTWGWLMYWLATFELSLMLAGFFGFFGVILLIVNTRPAFFGECSWSAAFTAAAAECGGVISLWLLISALAGLVNSRGIFAADITLDSNELTIKNATNGRQRRWPRRKIRFFRVHRFLASTLGEIVVQFPGRNSVTVGLADAMELEKLSEELNRALSR